MQAIEHVPAFVWWLVAIAVIAGWVLRSNRITGLRGELSVRFAAWRGLRGVVYHRMHNVTLRTPDGATQIDHVFISPFGVFVVETKHIRGWIFGKEDDRQWTQVISGEKWHFQNPVRQIYKHVKAVEHALGVQQSAIHSVVVFTAHTTFKTVMPSNVTLRREFVGYVKSFRDVILTQEQVSSFVSELHRKALPKSHILRQQHIQRVRQRSNPNAYRRCPKCGSRMAIRTARRGSHAGHQFWACSAYPKCRYTQDVS